MKVPASLRRLALIMALCMLLSSMTVLFCLSVSGDDTPTSDSEDAPGLDLDSDPGTLTYTYSEDGSTVTISYMLNGEQVSYTVPNNYNYTSGSLACTDDLGRTMYTSTDVGSYGSTGEHYVGLFYFLWQGEHGDSGVFDLQKIIDENGVETAGKVSSGAYGNQGAMHWFAEPLYGYYYANDEWVHRKHMELLTQANIDFLYFDVTNGYYYLNNALQVMKACHELNEQGFDAPQVVFYTHSGSANVVRGLYNDIYSKGLYEDTWFKLDGKPVIIAPYEDNIDDFFTIKREQWPNDPTRNVNAWPWMDFNWPQRVFKGTDANGDFNGQDAISVSIAQHSGNVVFSSSALYGYTGNRGRSFNATRVNDTTLAAAWQAAFDDYTLSYQGLNFQAQFDRAIKTDATFVLVTGWNEWVAQRQDPNILGADKVVFIDTGSVEYSRDAEMMRGGYFDNYYIQLSYNVQKIKGTAPVVLQDARNPIDVTGDFAQWDKVTVTYADAKGDTQDRNGKGFGRQTYTNTTGRNDIVSSKVTSDSKNVYFYVETAEDITALDKSSSWMQLFINVDNQTTGWYGYDYIVNYIAEDASTTTVGKYIGTDNSFDFAIQGKVSYKIEGNKMMIAVPQSMLGITGYREIDFQFKWVDSDTVMDTMESFYENGDCAPLGRMNYVYQNYIPGVSDVHYPELETEPETEAPTDPETVTEAPIETATVPADVTDSTPGTQSTTTTGKGCASIVTSSVLVSLTAVMAGAVLSLRKNRNR